MGQMKYNLALIAVIVIASVITLSLTNATTLRGVSFPTASPPNSSGGGGGGNGTGNISGGGIAGYIPKFKNSNTIINSLLYDTGSQIILTLDHPLFFGGNAYIDSNSATDTLYIDNQLGTGDVTIDNNLLVNQAGINDGSGANLQVQGNTNIKGIDNAQGFTFSSGTSQGHMIDNGGTSDITLTGESLSNSYFAQLYLSDSLDTSGDGRIFGFQPRYDGVDGGTGFNDYNGAVTKQSSVDGSLHTVMNFGYDNNLYIGPVDWSQADSTLQVDGTFHLSSGGDATFDGNINVGGTAFMGTLSSDGGSVTTDGSGTLTILGALLSDQNRFVTDGFGNLKADGNINANNYSAKNVSGSTKVTQLLKDANLVASTKTYCNMTFSGGIRINSTVNDCN